MSQVLPKLPTSTAKPTGTVIPGPHEFKAVLSGDTEFATLLSFGNAVTDAKQNAIDEYYRMYNLLPASVTMIQLT